jgi:hypothetical protein
MQRVEAAARAANKVFDTLLDLEAYDLLVLPEKRIRQHYRVMHYYSEVLHGLCQAQEPLLDRPLPKELTDLLAAN